MIFFVPVRQVFFQKAWLPLFHPVIGRLVLLVCNESNFSPIPTLSVAGFLSFRESAGAGLSSLSADEKEYFPYVESLISFSYRC